MNGTMTDIKHHLSDEILMAYSAGSLPEAFDLVVATHISMCDDCRARMHSFDAVGGSVLETTDEIEMSDGAFEATLKLISSLPKDPILTERPAPTPGGLFPQPLAEYVGGDLEAVKWRPVGMGVKQAILKTTRDATVRLLYIPTGCSVPDHGHEGTEITLVLQGAFQDETSLFGVGDVELADQDLEHTPVAVGAEDCICLAATDAKLRFNSLMPKLAQPFLRI